VVPVTEAHVAQLGLVMVTDMRWYRSTST